MENSISKYFTKVQDPRSKRNQRHSFMSIVGTSLLSMLSGIESFSGMQDFAEAHYEELEKHFKMEYGFPSHDTYRRFWNNINPNEFLNSFHLFTESLCSVQSNLISIDGKTIRNSGKKNPLHIVSAWCRENKLVLAQEKVSDKSNEITAIPKLLELLDIENTIITIDAMGAQRQICQKIIDQGGDYVICLKKNQGTLYKDVKLYLEDVENHQLINEDNDKGHGRIEQRIAISNDDIEWLCKSHKWPGLKSVGMVNSIITKIKTNKTTYDQRFYISSLKANARKLNDIVRSHWGIENQLHWRLDVVFNEDKACVSNDNAAENLGILRKWALNMLHKVKEKPSQSIKSVMRKNSMSLQYLFDNVNKIFHA